jgi:hypothetical protein
MVRRAVTALLAVCIVQVGLPASGWAHHKPYSARINDVAVNEGNSGTTPLSFTITLAPVPTETLTLNYRTSDGSAVAGRDYTAASGSATFSSGQDSKTVTVLAHGDADFEGDETLNVDLGGSGKRVHITDNRGIGTILNEDSAPGFSVSDIQVTEGDSGEGNAVFDVTLDKATASPVMVNYATVGLSATGGDTAAVGVDFENMAGTLNFAAGDVSEPVAVPVFGDTTDEDDETLRLDLSGNNPGTIINDGTGTGTIEDNDPEPSVSVSEAVANEPGDASSTNTAVFGVSLSAVSEKTVRVNYTTADLNPAEAVADADYNATSGTLVFAPGERTKEVEVPILYDGIDPSNREGFERFHLNLDVGEGANASLREGTALGVITEETVPKLYATDVALDEGDEGQRTAIVSLTLSAPTAGVVNGTFDTVDATATPATADTDYVRANGGFSFDGSSRRRTTVEVAVKGDTVDEENEMFDVVLNTPDVELGEDTGTVTILDDDVPPIVSIGDVRITEGNAGPTTVNLTVSLSTASGRSISLQYATGDGTAVSPADYEADSGEVILAAGETSRSIGIQVEGDSMDEAATENFFVDITPEADRATEGDGRGTATIEDDDKTPTTTTLRARRGRRILAKGLLGPAVPGKPMVVRFFRQTGGGWVRVATHRPTLSAAKDVNGDGDRESTYRTYFRKPQRGRMCKVVSRYPGDATHFASKAINKLRCRR